MAENTWIGTYGVIKNIGGVGAVVVESFIYHIPSVTLPLVVGHFILDVILEDGDESRISPCSTGDPRW